MIVHLSSIFYLSEAMTCSDFTKYIVLSTRD